MDNQKLQRKLLRATCFTIVFVIFMILNYSYLITFSLNIRYLLRVLTLITYNEMDLKSKFDILKITTHLSSASFIHLSRTGLIFCALFGVMSNFSNLEPITIYDSRSLIPYRVQKYYTREERNRNFNRQRRKDPSSQSRYFQFFNFFKSQDTLYFELLLFEREDEKILCVFVRLKEH